MKKYIVLLIGLCFMFTLAACGEKSKEDVVGKLEKMVEEMNAYETQALMKLKTGKEEQAFRIDVTHKKNDFYRVLLKNEQDEGSSQIILRNEDGVFVLTPALNKSFKFQSDWPANNSQPYLVQSLIQDIVDDKEAIFTQTEEYFVFETKTSYESNSNLPYQTIYFDKKTYAPVLVKVLDHDRNELVEVEFTSFTLDPELPEDTFSMEKNMTSSILGIPVMADEDTSKELTVYYPAEQLGAELIEENQMDTENGKRVMLSYEGEKNFTIIQEVVTTYPTSTGSPEVINGDPVDLGFTVGAMSQASIEWQYNGVNYYLASDQLTKQEMIDVATSIHTQAIK
ncbi:outer membrane lipoprotein carrier protein LolA [Gracilibacillus marinus]|uniref:Outer membrane lipoprotein carrier protein LolA n=1 Tax=Gracilibacillus marinus TaxID=630535 RepID=A0ABV8VUH8_9BACI